jgi:hypothetical protein
VGETLAWHECYLKLQKLKAEWVITDSLKIIVQEPGVTMKKIRSQYFAGILRIIEFLTRFSSVNVRKIRRLNEYLTWHFELIMQKKALS